MGVRNHAWGTRDKLSYYYGRNEMTNQRWIGLLIEEVEKREKEMGAPDYSQIDATSTIYRTNVAPGKSEIMTGRLIKKYHQDKTCTCQPPSWWARMFMKLQRDDEWECAHRFRWRWTFGSWDRAESNSECYESR